MDLPSTYIDKFRPAAAPKSGAPRCERDDLIDRFLASLNPEQIADSRPPYTFARVAKMLQGQSDQRLYQLLQECSAEGVRSFGAMLNYKLKSTV